MFFGIFAVFALLEFNVYVAAIIAAALSFALSLVVLDKQRDRLSESVHQKLARGKDGSYADADSDHENALLDQQTETSAGERRVDDEEAEPKQ